MSDWLIHFTKGNNDEANRRLINILSEGIKGRGRPICFTESPIIEFSKLFKLFSAYPNPRFAPFGIAIKKDKLFDLGGETCNLFEEWRERIPEGRDSVFACSI